jgi:sugar/nucleoside kinase (ribokinase family)
VGNAARDVLPAPPGWRLGGTIAFAAAQADRLGLPVGVVTRAGPDLDVAAELPFASVVSGKSAASTSFENVYTAEGRTQRLLSEAGSIAVGDVPAPWLAAPVVLLGPVFGEIGPDLAVAFAPGSLVGVSAQGWVRAADLDGKVWHQAWAGAPYWIGADVLFASDEDLAGDEAELERWIADVPIVAVTRSSRGARVFSNGRVMEMGAYPSVEVDATGAGDTFATAFLVRFHETRDVSEAALFGAAAASLSVEGVGASTMGDRAAIEARMAAHPDVRLV